MMAVRHKIPGNAEFSRPCVRKAAIMEAVSLEKINGCFDCNTKRAFLNPNAANNAFSVMKKEKALAQKRDTGGFLCYSKSIT